MFLFLIWIYVFLLAFIYLVFIMLRINAIKFKNISSNIEKNSNKIFILLTIFSILWFLIIIFLNYESNKIVDESQIKESVYY